MQAVTKGKTYSKNDLKSVFYRRARSKFLSNAVALNLIRLHGLDETEYKRFERMILCAGTLQLQNDKMISHYCSNRFCLVCARIRTANLINGYGATIEAIPDKSFLTLTVKNCKGSELRDQLVTLKKEFFLLRKAIKKQYKLKIDGMRKIEVTYNKQSDTYHPHFHILMQDDSVLYQDEKIRVTQLMLQKWLHRFPETTNIKAQKTVPATAGDCKEMFKYFTKLISKDKETGKHKMIPAKNLRLIMAAVTGTRIFQTYGKIRKLKPEPVAKLEQLQLNYYFDEKLTTFVWTQKNHDWLNCYTGEIFTGYKPAELLMEALSENGFNNIPPEPELPDKIFLPTLEHPPEPYKHEVKINNEFMQGTQASWGSLYIDCTGRLVNMNDFIIKN